MPTPIRVLLVDDHALFREALRMSLEMSPDIEVVAEAHSSTSTLAALAQSLPDVVCMDINLVGYSGIELTRQLLALYPDLKIIGLSADSDPTRVADMRRAGACGYVIKAQAGVDLPQAIREALLSQP